MTDATKPVTNPATKSVATPAVKVAAKKAPAKKVVAKKAPAKKVASPRVSAVKALPQAKKAVDTKEQPAKKPKHKLVRDSFTMPSNDFQLIEQLKQRALGFKRPAKKSELLRAGLHALAGLGDAKLKLALDALDPLKPGRPRKTPA